MLGVDRLDMIKGIPQKILAFEKFLEENPDWRDKVVLLQIAVPTRTDVPECMVILYLLLLVPYVLLLMVVLYINRIYFQIVLLFLCWMVQVC